MIVVVGIDPSDRDLSNYFQEYIDLPFEHLQEKFRKLNITRFLDKTVDTSVVEVGCGRESIFSVWSPTAKAQIIEPIGSFIESAFARINDQKIENVVTYQGTLNDYVLSFHKDKFDVTILSSILHEVSNPKDFLLQAREITKPGGKLILVVPNKMSVHRILGLQMGLQKTLNSKTTTEIRMQQFTGASTFEELENQILGADLVLERIESFFVKLLPHIVMQNLIDEEIMTVNDLVLFDNLSKYLPGMGSEIIAVARVPK
jgi:SAM-dependent methyltransferase